jgi:hypothetical protein
MTCTHFPGFNSYLDCKNPIFVPMFGEFLQFFDLTGAEESYAIRINEVSNNASFRVSAIFNNNLAVYCLQTYAFGNDCCGYST